MNSQKSFATSDRRNCIAHLRITSLRLSINGSKNVPSNRKTSLLATLVAPLFLLSGNNVSAFGLYRTTPIPSLVTGSGRIVPTSINANGQVVGTAGDVLSDPHGFVWNVGDSVSADLGPVVLSPLGNNFFGEIVGTRLMPAQVSSGFPFTREAFLWSEASGFTTLNSFVSNSSAIATNDIGEVAGTARTTSGTDHAVIWQNGQIRDIDNRDADVGQSYALDLNNFGEVVGYSVANEGGFAGPTRGFVWTDAKGMVEISALDRAYGINDVGQIIGQDDGRAVFVANGSPTNIDVLPGGSSNSPASINAQGHVVGSSGTATQTHGFIWKQGGPSQDLNDLIAPGDSFNGVITSGAAINDRGQIAAVIAATSPADFSGVLLTPITEFVPGDTSTRPNENRLHVLGNSFDASKATIVLTHGWEPGIKYTPEVADQLLELTASVVSELNLLGLRDDVNVLSFEWSDAYGPSAAAEGFFDGSFRRAQAKTQSAGYWLAKELITNGVTDETPLHFVGHSLGTMVSSYAIEKLSSQGISADQLTLLDPPLASPTLDEEFFHLTLPNTLDYVDNYFATIATEGFGGRVAGALPGDGGELVFVDHEGVHADFYANRVLTSEWISAIFPDTFPSSQRPERDQWNPVDTNPSQRTLISYAESFVDTAEALATYEIDSARGGWIRVVNNAETIKKFEIEVLQQKAQLFVDAAGNIVFYGGALGGSILSTSIDFESNEATFLLDIGGASVTTVGTFVESWLGLAESSPVVIRRDVSVPVTAQVLEFSFLMPNVGDGDWLTVHFNDQLIWSFLGEEFFGDESHAVVSVTPFAGQIGSLYFSLNSVGERNAEFFVRDVRFVGSAPVPIPVPGLLLVSAIPALLSSARHHRDAV